MVANRPLFSETLAEGLVIDDYFAVAVTPISSDPGSKSVDCYATANRAYSKNQLLGSPQKDLVDEAEGRVIGAYLNGSERATSRGMVTVSAPISKRLGLAYLSLLLAQLPYTTDSLHLCLIGGWVSAMTYRRPSMSILQKSFQVVNMMDFDKNEPKLVPLSRKVAEELVLLSVLMPMLSTDIAVDFDCRVFCTDASTKKGAILEAEVSRQTAEILWRNSRSKGAYTRLQTPLESLLKNLGALEEEGADDCRAASPARPIAFRYDFLEVFAGASKITSILAARGYVCGPPLDLSRSPEYDLTKIHVISWLTFLVGEGRLHAFFLSPPCTSFSIMRRPRLRSAEEPFGFDTSDPQTRTGTELASRSMQLMYVGSRNDAAGISENPYSSYMKCLPAWQIVKGLDCADEARCDSCQFGSLHQKSFRFLSVNADLRPVRKRCRCSTKHLQVQGKYTKASATYTDQLALAISTIFDAFLKSKRQRLKTLEEGETKGLESQFVNDLAQTLQWKLKRQWTFRKQSHSNILEESAILRLCNDIAKEGVPRRLSVLVDSNVVRCATSKGRSSSLGLSSILRRVHRSWTLCKHPFLPNTP